MTQWAGVPVWNGLLLGSLCAWLLGTPGRSDGPVPAPAPVLRAADLDADATLDAVPEPQEASLLGYAAAVQQRTKHPIIILGNPHLAPDDWEQLRGKPAREVLRRLAKELKSEWQEYRGFYLIAPKTYVRHSVRPASLARQHPALARKVTGVHGGYALMAVPKLGKAAGLVFLVGGLETLFSDRSKVSHLTEQSLIAAEGRTLDEVMQALTALTGDPWERIGTPFVLSVTGASLSEGERGQLQVPLAIVELASGLRPAQVQLLTSPGGLRAAHLAPDQRVRLAAATANIRQRGGYTIDEIVLRRIPYRNEGLAAGIFVYAVARDGKETDIGRIIPP